MQWLPVETAPKDGTSILGYGYTGHNQKFSEHVVICYSESPYGASPWLEASGEGYARYTLLAWTPLPPPPTKE